MTACTIFYSILCDIWVSNLFHYHKIPQHFVDSVALFINLETVLGWRRLHFKTKTFLDWIRSLSNLKLYFEHELDLTCGRNVSILLVWKIRVTLLLFRSLSATDNTIHDTSYCMQLLTIKQQKNENKIRIFIIWKPLVVVCVFSFFTSTSAWTQENIFFHLLQYLNKKWVSHLFARTSISSNVPSVIEMISKLNKRKKKKLHCRLSLSSLHTIWVYLLPNYSRTTLLIQFVYFLFTSNKKETNMWTYTETHENSIQCNVPCCIKRI